MTPASHGCTNGVKFGSKKFELHICRLVIDCVPREDVNKKADLTVCNPHFVIKFL